MCLIGLALGAHADFPVVIAANRDEFHDRPAAPLKWWLPAEATAPILAGRDLSAGGTWIGLARNGRIGLVTNVRAPSRQRAAGPRRGGVVAAWLAADGTTESHWWAVVGGWWNRSEGGD